MRGALYGSLVIVYLFLGGAAAGALFVMSAWSFAFRRSENPARLLTAFESLRSRTYTVGFLLLAFAMICLLGDLGNPGRALMVFFLPHPHCHHLRCLYARHRSPFGGASAGGIAAEQPPYPSRALAGYRRSPLLHRGPGDDGLYGNIPFPGQHPLLESLVNHRPVCVFLSFIGSIRRAVNRLVHARSVPFVARDQAAPDMPCGLPCCRGGILDLIRQRGFSEPLGRRFPQPFDGTRDAGHCGRRRDWHGNRAAHYARNLLDYSKGMPCHTCLGLHLLAWRIMLALLPHYMRSPLTEA